ncbi:PGF-pre-PGF domain-containing protein [Candidatus Woesearchaeota archaeon]|nr:PGF-pre-PGF domain-containing protein [Candidatus Woesearchaeota archaeon]
MKKAIITLALGLLFFISIAVASDFDTDLQLSSSVVDQGESVTLTVTATNNGGSTATGVEAEISFLPASGLSTSVAEKPITQSGQSSGTITAGNSGTVTFTIDTDLSGDYTIYMHVAGTIAGSEEEDDTEIGLTVDSSMPVTADLIVSESSIDYEEPMTISGKVNNNKNTALTGVQVTLSASGFSVSGASTKSLGTINAGSSKTATWSVTAPSTCGSKSVSISVSSSGGNPTDSASISVTGCPDEEQPPGEETAASSPGLSGGGSTIKAIKSWINVTSGEQLEMVVNKSGIYLSKVTFKMTEDNELITLILEAISSLPENMSQIEEEVYQIINIKPLNFGESDIEDLRVWYSVSKAWLKEQSLVADDVVLFSYYNNKWNEITANKASQDSDKYYFYSDVAGLEYLIIAARRPYLISSLTPTIEEVKYIGEQALDDPLIITKLQEYLEFAIDVESSKQATGEIAELIELSKSIKQIDQDSTSVEIIIKNTANQSIKDIFLIEAIPKAIIENIAEIKDPLPRVYDIVIKEDPIIQWRFREFDTSVVAWKIDLIEAMAELKLSYKIDSLFQADDHVSSIVVKVIQKEEGIPTGDVISVEPDLLKGKGISKLLQYILLGVTIFILAGVVVYVVKFAPKEKKLSGMAKAEEQQKKEQQKKKDIRATEEKKEDKKEEEDKKEKKRDRKEKQELKQEGKEQIDISDHKKGEKHKGELAELEKFVRSALNEGYTKEEVGDMLKKHKWDQNIIEKVLKGK